MPLGTYTQLQEAVLNWLGRPGDALLAPHVPDMIQLAEVELNRRIRSLYNEYVAGLPMTAGFAAVQLPADYLQMQAVRVDGGGSLEYVSVDRADEFATGSGAPRYYTISQGGEATAKIQQLQLYPTPDADGQIRIRYWQVIPYLGWAGVTTNWLLDYYPDAYLFSTLCEAAAFIGEDERLQMWVARREATIEAINREGIRLARGHSLQTVPDFMMPRGGGGGGTAAAASAIPPASSSAVTTSSARTVYPFSGDTVGMIASDRELFVSSAALALLTIRLPPASAMSEGEAVEVSFAAPIAELRVHDSTGMPVADAPDSAYGPGAAIVMRWMGGEWLYWK